MDASIRKFGPLNRSLVIASLLLAVTFPLPSCTTRSNSRRQADAAFRAGQQRALVDVATRQNGITFVGPVVNAVVPWRQGLTLGQAVAAAGWNAQSEPRLIIFARGEETAELTPAQLLQAAAFPVEPGDRVEILP